MLKMSLVEFCERTGKPATTVRDWCRLGRISAEKAGNEWLVHLLPILPSEAEQYKEDQEDAYDCGDDGCVGTAGCSKLDGCSDCAGDCDSDNVEDDQQDVIDLPVRVRLRLSVVVE